MENIYIETLQIGVAHMDRGISCNEVKRHFEDSIPSDEFETTYINWFYANFFESNVHVNVKAFNTDHVVILQSFAKYNDETAHISGDAIFKYYQYLELKEARGSASKAHKISLMALTISAIASAASIIGIIISLKI